MESLKTKTARGLFWSVLDSFGVYFVKFGFSVAIARTLAPEDYGLMGMIVIFISLGQMLMQSGFSMALIQKKDISEADRSTAFIFNLSVALAVYAILFFSAGHIASFFERPILINITRVAALGIVLNALCSVQVAVLNRALDFRRLTLLNLISSLVSGITGLSLALKGFSVWALVFQTLSGNAIYAAGLWITSKWRPVAGFNRESFRALFGFGYKILLQGVTDVIFTKSYFPIIGKFYSATQLGYYTNASRFHDLFVKQTSNSFTRVAFPAFSSIQEEDERFNRNYIRSFGMLSVLMFLGAVTLIAVIRPFVSLVLTEKWLPAVPLMQLFFAEGFVLPLLLLNQNIILALGKSGLSLKLDVARKTMILFSILLLYRVGIGALIAGQVAVTAILLVVSLIVVVRAREIRLREIFVPLMKLVLITGSCMLIDLHIINRLVSSDWLVLLIKITLIPGLFILLAGVLRLDSLAEVRKYVAELNLFNAEK